MRAILYSCPFERKRPESGLSPYGGTGIDRQGYAGWLAGVAMSDHRQGLSPLECERPCGIGHSLRTEIGAVRFLI